MIFKKFSGLQLFVHVHPKISLKKNYILLHFKLTIKIFYFNLNSAENIIISVLCKTSYLKIKLLHRSLKSIQWLLNISFWCPHYQLKHTQIWINFSVKTSKKLNNFKNLIGKVPAILKCREKRYLIKNSVVGRVEPKNFNCYFILC